MDIRQQRRLLRIGAALLLFIVIYALTETGTLKAWFGQNALAAEFALFLAPWLIAGYDVLLKAARNIAHGQVFDENFLMSVATIGAFALVLFPESDPHMAEGAAVMLFYQVGEFFQDYAVNKSRKSIAGMMDIAPDYANTMHDGQLVQVDPYDIAVGDEIVVKPGERVPLDGMVVAGTSQLDTAALTGESAPRSVEPGCEVVSGCVNMTGVLTVRATKEYGDSTVQRILELVETAADKKARTESFITRFARYYTPVVVGVAVALAVLPPLLLGGGWASWIERGLIFLVVSCPCALVISVPLSFFGGIGGASRKGILVKGSNYLEALAQVDTVVFDKTGTLTNGTFAVTEVRLGSKTKAPAKMRETDAGDISRKATIETITEAITETAAEIITEATTETAAETNLLRLAAYAEAFSDHPIALSVKKTYGWPIDTTLITDYVEESGRGVSALVNGHEVLVGNDKLMRGHDIAIGNDKLMRKHDIAIGNELPGDESAARDAEANPAPGDDASGTVLHVAVDGLHLGSLLISDAVKPDAAEAIARLRSAGVKHTVMLTGDRKQVAARVAADLGIDEFRAELLPQDKVEQVEHLLEEVVARTNGKGKLAFVGDGINDAPVLMRADVGVAMGAMGSDAAIEAADIVLMDDKPSHLPTAVRIARKTMGIVWQNIVFALGVKFAVLILAALGMANLWLAVFADVGVAVLAILNAMRAMRVSECG